MRQPSPSTQAGRRFSRNAPAPSGQLVTEEEGEVEQLRRVQRLRGGQVGQHGERLAA
jgi:hypothetical protein